VKATLAPNGRNRYQGQEPCTCLFVGTADGVVTLEREGPDGAWAPTARALQGQHVGSLLLEPRRGGIFAGTHRGGLYASLDGGQTWEPRSRGLNHDNVYTLASVERDGAIVLYAGTQPAHLYQSTDYGERWDELPALRQVADIDRWTFPAPPHVAHVKDVAFDPRDSRTMYVAVEQGALLKSADGGQTWRELDSHYGADNLWYKDIHRLAISPTHPDRLYMTSGDGLYRSEDAGETWEHVTDTTARIGYPDGLLLSPEADTTLFMAGGHTSPNVWRESHDANAAIARSTDGGRTWEFLSQGLPDYLWENVEALSMAVWPGGFSLFAGTARGEVFASDDRGTTWSRIAAGLPRVGKDNHVHLAEAAELARTASGA
jgi:photosystem II stability/assembly factor-like uncharacterized protein